MSELLVAYAAGALSSLSPCVLPVVPLIVGSALHRSRFAPLLIGAGQVVTFAAAGLAMTAFGALGGIPATTIRVGAGLLLFASGLVLLVPAVSGVASRWLSPVAQRAAQISSRLARLGPLGYLGVGALLGVVWSPCTGPFLGGVVGLAAAQGVGTSVILTTTVFGLGATTPLILAAYAMALFAARRASLGRFAVVGKMALGVGMVAVGLLVMSGFDKVLEARAVDLLPEAWLNLTTRL